MKPVFAIAAAVALSLAGCRCDEAAERGAPSTAGGQERSAPDPASLPDGPVTCPVCGLEFDGKEAVATRAHGGRTYYFLVADHARAFAENPEAYLKK